MLRAYRLTFFICFKNIFYSTRIESNMTGSITSSTNCNCSAVVNHNAQVEGEGLYRSVAINRITFVGDNTPLTCDTREEYKFAIMCHESRGSEGASSPTEILFIALSLFFFVVAIILYVKLQKTKKSSNGN